MPDFVARAHCRVWCDPGFKETGCLRGRAPVGRVHSPADDAVTAGRSMHRHHGAYRRGDRARRGMGFLEEAPFWSRKQLDKARACTCLTDTEERQDFVALLTPRILPQ